jgi:hypothetical protein
VRTIAHKFFNHPSASKKILITLVVLVVWSFFLWRAIEVFKPGIKSLHYFNSDCAIPVLMSNDDRPITLFNLYYYGQDRWGGWPFLFAQVFRRATGYRWSDQSLSAEQITWLFIGALVLAGLSRKTGLVAALAFLLTLCLHGETRYQIFWLSQVYAWQVTAVLLSWYCLRKLLDGTDETANYHRWKQYLPLFLTFWFSYLAIWSSVASLPFLLFLTSIEILRARLISGDSALRLSIRAFAPFVLAALIEQLQKLNYHRHALKHYGSDFATRFEIDFGYLLTNLRVQLAQLKNLSWWPLDVVAALAILTLIFVLAYSLLKKRTKLLTQLKDLLRDDTAILAIGTFGLAAINFVLAVVVSHVRINVYEDRYLTFTSLFGPIAGMLVLFLLFNSFAGSMIVRRLAQPVFLVVGLVLLTVKFPLPGERDEYRIFSETAAALAQKAPRGILLGDYWGTYVFAALQPVNGMTPVPIEGKENRMPWTRDQVRAADSAVVEYQQSKLEQAGQPPSHLVQYGASLTLADPNLYRNGDYAFALYRRDK